MKKNKIFSLFIVLIMILGVVFVLNGCKKEEKPPVSNGPSGSDEPDLPGPTPEPEENKEISVIELGNLRIQLLSDSIVRIENKGSKGFEDRPSYIVPNRDNYDHVEYTTEKQNGVTVIKTDKYSVHIPDGGKAEDAYITSPDGEKLWAYSDAGRTDTNVYLPSPSDDLRSWYFTDSPRIIPSEHGYSYKKDVTILQDWDYSNNALDVFVFLPDGDYSKFCSDYIRVTGESEMVSLQTFGYWDSRWYPYSSKTAIDQIIEYMDRGYSIDVMVIDTDWRASQSDGQGSGGIGYDINTSLFPDMAAFLQECEDLGVDICFNDHPEPVKGTNNGLDQAEVKYRGDKLTLILSLGVDYWWYDRNWSVSLNSCDPDISAYAFGMYAYQWITEEYRDSVVDWDEFAERSLIMANVDGVLHGKWYYASDISAHRYSIQWTGDIGANSDALAQEIYTSVFGGAEVGLPYISSDIGGHSAPVTDEMYARWIQYGALSTICRVHCTNEKYIHQEGRMPWLFGETAEEVAHTYLDMRYRLLPLYYSLARENYDTGLPIMQRLDIQYPQYVEASRNDEYLLGDYILVAPINETDAKVPNALFSYNGNEGLKAEYYNNNNWSGSPVLTRIESNIYYDWGTGGPSDIDLVDNFSIKWTGNITIGDKDAALTFFADDAIVVYIDGVKVVDGLNVYDTLLSTPVYKANSTHSIEVRYAEYGYNAHVYVRYVQQGDSYCYNTRDVFIPDGTWIDVWSGERYVGPATYSVTHPLETSPIFVREGSLVALAPNMINTSDKDWKEMVLDVYPSRNFDAGITLYEDDTKTDAYKAGFFRTTDITMDYDTSIEALLLKIHAAEGEFEGDLAFTDRKWRVRLHTNPDWGSVTSIVINGQVVDFEFISKSASGKPFAFEGASPDGNVYEFWLRGSVYEDYDIKVFYSSSKDSNTNTSYEKQDISFELSFDEAGEGVELKDSAIDWIAYGENNNTLYATKDGLNTFSTTASYDTPWVQSGNFVKLFDNGGFSSTSLNSQKDFSFEINVDKNADYYVLYLGGYQSTAKVTVRDTAGNVKTVNFGNIDGSYTKRVIIKTNGDEGKLYVTYSMVASEYTKNIYNNNSYDIVCYLSMYAAASYTEMPERVELSDDEISVKASGNVDATGSVNLTQVGDLDWMHFGSQVDIVQKSNGNILGNVVFGTSFKFYDYKMSISYTDGVEQSSNSGSTNGICSGEGITLTLNIDSSVKNVILYTGAWKATNKIEVYSANGKLLATSQQFTAGTTAVNKVVTFAVNATEDSIITIKIINPGTAGNVSLAAVAVSSSDKVNEDTGSDGDAITINHLNLDGSLIESESIKNYSFPYTASAKSFAGLVPSHDYVIIKDADEAKVVNIYYSEIDVWDGKTVSSSLSGSGTASNPYLIESGADLAYIDQNMTATENFKGIYFKLTKSIDLNGNSVKIGAYPDWSGRIIFSGIFDGNNCSIRNLNMTESGMGAGLFSVLSGTVKNLTVYGTVKGNDKMTGGIVGWLYQGNLENCSNYVNVTSTGSAETGGVVGTCQGNITKCINYGSVVGKDGVGGIAGFAGGTLTSCRNYGDVSGTSNVNQIFGAAHSSGAPIITDCGAEYEFFVDETIIQDPTDYDYSFAIIGDQQVMVQYARETNSDKNFKQIYDYIIDYAESKNIKHVFNLGDIVQTTYEYDQTNTDEHKSRMDKEAEFAYKQIARLDGVVDYSLVRGNHDGPICYEQYFGVNSTYTGYGSHIEDYYINSSNSVHYFSAGELDYMVITLDFGAGDPVLEWANEIIAAHPNHNVIITTHAYMHRDGNLLANSTLCPRKPDGTNDPLYNTAMGAVANNGDDMWNKLVSKHANIVLVLSGHVGSDDVVCTQLTGDNGNVVTNILINPQDIDTRYKSSGGVGAVAMFYFSDGGKTIDVRYYSTVQDAYIKSENQFTFTINTIPREN